MSEKLEREIAELKQRNDNLGSLLVEVNAGLQKTNAELQAYKKETQAQIFNLESQLQDARKRMDNLGH